MGTPGLSDITFKSTNNLDFDDMLNGYGGMDLEIHILSGLYYAGYIVMFARQWRTCHRHAPSYWLILDNGFIYNDKKSQGLIIDKRLKDKLWYNTFIRW